MLHFFEAANHPAFLQPGWDAESVMAKWQKADETREELLEHFCAQDGSGFPVLPRDCVKLLEVTCMNDPVLNKVFNQKQGGKGKKPVQAHRGRLVCGSMKVARSSFGWFWRKLYVTGTNSSM